MNDDKPKMSNSCFYYRVCCIAIVEPVKKLVHFCFYQLWGYCFVMDFFFAHCTRNDLHFACAITGYFNFMHSAKSRRKKGGMPGKQSFFGQWLQKVLGCIKHHIHNA